MARHLFGTDGVRGVAGRDVTAELALGLASAAVRRISSADTAPQVLVLRDTRESGEMLEAATAAGIAQAGGTALLGGVLPTPAAPLLVRRYGLDLGVVLSASHNPFEDNGIKFFGADGHKLSDEIEEEIEALYADGAPSAGGAIGRVRAFHGTLEDYLRELHTHFEGLDLGGLDVVLDCAHGAAYRAAPEIFRRLGADVTTLGVDPDGRNINDGVGSTHVETLAAAVVQGGHDIGFAFDGDADRVLAADRRGHIVDGDELIALAAVHLREAGRLQGNGVAVTVMTNYGFHTAMRDAGIEVVTTAVGDRYILEALREKGWALGGEQSGHIMDLEFAPSGDGIAAALLALKALSGADLAERHAMEKLPQRLVNVRVDDRDAAMSDPAIAQAREREAEALEGRGRVLVRPSGTEPLVRVMVEAPSEDEAAQVCDRLVQAVQAVRAEA